MDDAFPIILIAGIIVLGGVLAYFSYLWERKRREAFALLAAKLGMNFAAGKDFRIASRFEFLDRLCQGSNRYAYNILEGPYNGRRFLAFDYHFETYSTDSKGNHQTHHHHFSFFILFLDREFPELRIYPENFLSKIGQAIGFDDIDFESVEFSKAFTVRSADKKFAYDICHARMMEHLLSDPKIAIEIERECLALAAGSRLDPAQVPAQFDRLLAVRALFPQYLFDA